MSEEQVVYWLDTIEVCTIIIAGEKVILWRNGGTVWKNYNVKDRHCAILIKTYDDSSLSAHRQKYLLMAFHIVAAYLRKLIKTFPRKHKKMRMINDEQSLLDICK